MKGLTSRTVRLLMALLMVVPSLLFMNSTSALNILSERLIVGTSVAGEVTTHDYSMNLQSSSNIGSIQFLYCEEGPIHNTPCTAPTGLDVSGASLDAESGVTGFSLHASTTANNIVLTRPSAAVTAPIPVTYNFSNITNPTTPDISHFIRITTYASDDASGSSIDEGAVIFSTSGRLAVGGFVPPRLSFCNGITVASDCSSFSGALISLGDLDEFSPRFASSQFAVSTNYPGGYTVFVNGTTMTSGVNIIQPNTTAQPNNPGTGQFGINLVANSDPLIGANIDGVGTGAVSANYNSTNLFRFVGGEAIASSPLPTEYNRYTVSYLVNVPDDQPPGNYSATLQYLAVASF